MENKWLEKLGINKECYYDSEEDCYVVDLEDSNEFSKVYTLLDNADWLYLVSGDFSLQEEESTLIYETEDSSVIFMLEADFEKNKYSLKMED